MKEINKKTKSIILSAAAFLLLAIIITSALFMFVFNKNDKIDEKLIVAVQTAWDFSKSKEQPEYLTKIDELSSYELKSAKNENGTIIIIAEITSPDLKSQLSQFKYSDLPQTENEKEINDFLCEQIKKAELKKTEATIYATKSNDDYEVSFSENFVNLMTGNIYTYSQELMIEILEMQKEGGLK